MHRRTFLISAAALTTPLLAGCQPEPSAADRPEPAFDQKNLQAKFQALADRAAPGVLGVGVLDAQTGQTLAFNGDRPFPLQSVFKAALGAAVLAQIECSERLERLHRRICRPLDKPLLGGAPEGADDAGDPGADPGSEAVEPRDAA